MKLQYLAVIFLIIVLPIIMVLSQYIDYQIDAINLKYAYNTKLLDSTYDALKAYQLNTVNNAISDISAEKIENLEAAVKTFFNSLTTNFNYTGYNSSVMKEYVPAVVFAMYDGYYIYSPYRNVLTGVPSDAEDKDYSEDDSISHGIKSYVYYSCRYKDTGSNKYDVVITYTLDNYITIQGYATVDGTSQYINKSGYLVDGIKQETTGITVDGKEMKDYTYAGVTFTYNSTERLEETLGTKQYYYAKLNGTKYYMPKSATEENGKVFYINATGEIAVQASSDKNKKLYKEYYKFITKNNSAYRYYKEAYEFTSFVHKYFGKLTVENACDFNKDGNLVPISEILGDDSYFDTQPIFGKDTSNNSTTDNESNIPIQDANSSFNAHRSAIIRYTINKNLKPAITGFKEYSKAENAEFLMPEISEADWETIQNNVSIITFLQGFNIAGRDYNEYCVVANNLTKEYVDENDIYILDKNEMYYKPNDTSLQEDKILNWNSATNTWNNNTYAAGIWKINFERRNYQYSENDDNNYQTYYYYPIKYLGSYSSIVNSTSVDTTQIDLYNYMRAKEDDGTLKVSKALRTTYYTALGRERYGQYSVNKDIDIKPSALVSTYTQTVQSNIEDITLVAKYKNGDNWITLGENKWTNKGNIKLVGYAKDTVTNITGYVFKNTEPLDSDFISVASNSTEITKTKEDNNLETGEYTYKFYAKNGSGNTDYAETIVHIDKIKPLISNFKYNTNSLSKGSATLTATIEDEHSGIVSYAITQSESEPSSYDKNISATTQSKDISKEVKENGTYYVYVKDAAGNISRSEGININIDNIAPTITVTPEKADVCKNTQITIKITDAGGSGLKVNENGEVVGNITLVTKVMGRNNNGQEVVDENEITEEETDENEPLEEIEVNEMYEYVARKNNQGEYEATITIGEELSGRYTLYVGGDISDNAGNVADKQQIGNEEAFVFDNEAPLVELDMDEKDYTANKEIKITLKDELSGLKSNKGICYLSTSEETNTKTKQYDYTSGETFEIGRDLTGIYYIWIDSVSDKLGNETGEILIGKLILDNEAPTVIVSPTNTNVCKSTNVTVTLSDNENGSGLKEEEHYIYLSDSKEKITDGAIKYKYASGSPVTIGENLTKKYYLWVGDVEDKAGNVNKEHYIGEFTFDNTGPSVTLNQGECNGGKINVTTYAVDTGEAGIASYKYYIKQADENNSLRKENLSTNTNDSFVYENLTNGIKYTVWVVVTDAVGNSTKSNNIEVKLFDNYMISGGTTIQYKQTLADAINVAEDGYKITVMNSNTDTSTVYINKNLTINLNYKTISRDKPISISSNKTVTFEGEGNIEVIDSKKNAIYNSGNCIINCGTNGGISALEGNAIYLNNNSTLTVNSGKLKSTKSSAIYSLNAKTTVKLLGGFVEGETYGIEAKSDEVETVPEVTVGDKDEAYNSNAVLVKGKINSMYLHTIDNVITNNTINSNKGTKDLYDNNYADNKEWKSEEDVVDFPKELNNMTNADRVEVQAFDVYFYNGSLRTDTKQNKVLSGAYIQEIRTGYSIIDDKDDMYHYKCLYYVGTNNYYAVEKKTFNDLSLAIDAAKTEDTIVLLKDDYDEGSQNKEIKGNKDVTLLLNSYKLYIYAGAMNIESGSTLTITGNNAKLSAKNGNKGVYSIFNVGGKIKIYGIIELTGKAEQSIFTTSENGAIIDVNNGTLIMEDNGNNINTILIDMCKNNTICYIRGKAAVTLQGYANIYMLNNTGTNTNIRFNNAQIKVEQSGGTNQEGRIITLVMNQNKSSGNILFTKANILINRQDSPKISLITNGNNTNTNMVFNGKTNIKMESNQYFYVNNGYLPLIGEKQDDNTGTSNIAIKDTTIKSDVPIIEKKIPGVLKISGESMLHQTYNTNTYNNKDTKYVDNYIWKYGLTEATINVENTTVIIGDKDDWSQSYPKITSEDISETTLLMTGNKKFIFYNGIIRRKKL